MDNREANRNPHLTLPPNCSCVDCVNKRLGIIKHQKHSSLYHSSNKQRQPSYKRNVRHGTPEQQHPHNIPKLLKVLGKLGLNLLVLTTLGLLIWSSIKAFSHQWTPAIGCTVVIATLIPFILMCTQLSKRKYRKPSMSLTIFALIVLFLVTAFSGCEPMASYKDMALNKISTAIHSVNSTLQSPTTIPSQTTTPIIPTTPIPPVTPTIIQQQLQNPTWLQLASFLLNDDTDQHLYVYPTFVCHNFALMLQDHAKKAGWRCAVVDVQLSGYPDWYHLGIPSNTGHNCNAFQTTDMGLVYIDCTGMQAFYDHPTRMVKIVDIQIGMHYIPISFFSEAGWNDAWEDCGTITAINSISW